jgi:hypothetical protein
MRFLGELYSYRLIDSPVIFDTLYLIIFFGHGTPEVRLFSSNHHSTIHIPCGWRQRQLNVHLYKQFLFWDMPALEWNICKYAVFYFYIIFGYFFILLFCYLCSAALSKVNATSLLIDWNWHFPLPTHIFGISCLLTCQLVCFSSLLIFIHWMAFALAKQQDMLDPPEDCFRLRMVITLLETCGQFFDRGSSKRRLDRFLLYFQRYVLSKGVIPLDVEFDLQVWEKQVNLFFLSP